MVRYVKWNADRMKLSPMTMIISMRPDLFDAISDMWPCTYLSNRCLNPANGNNMVVINDETNVRMRDEMRAGNFLWVDGEQIGVVRDSNIIEHNWTDDPANHLPGEFSSDIYFIPLTVLGGMRVTGFQYFDQRLSVQATVPNTRDTKLWSTDNGLFLWNSTNADLCYDIRVTMEWRLIMQTPQLAGRLMHVKYAPLQHLREAAPVGPTNLYGLYNLDGGVTEQPIELFYNQWTSTQKQM
jgi:hypothetical protein